MNKLVVNFDSHENVDDNDIQALSYDKVYDTLEELEPLIKNQSIQLSHDIDNPLSRIALSNNAEALKQIDIMWEWLNQDEECTYYINKYEFQEVTRYKDDGFYGLAVNQLVYNLLTTGVFTNTYYDVEYTLDGAMVKEITETSPAYINVRVVNPGVHTVTQDDSGNKEYMESRAKALNADCRFFKCKDCGRIVPVLKADDEWKINNGLKPVKRCQACIVKRKQSASHNSKCAKSNIFTGK